MPGAAHPLLMLPSHPSGLRADHDAWRGGCARVVNGSGIMARTVPAAVPWFLQWKS